MSVTEVRTFVLDNMKFSACKTFWRQKVTVADQQPVEVAIPVMQRPLTVKHSVTDIHNLHGVGLL